jgi:hypothetical protein
MIVITIHLKGVALFSLINYSRLQYGDYIYPLWAELLGWCLALSSMLCIPIYVVYRLLKSPQNNFKKVNYLNFFLN